MNTKKVTEKIEKAMEEWTDEECLFNFTKFLERVGISCEFVQDDDGIVVAQVMSIHCGSFVVNSEPQALQWPLQPVPLPEELKDQVN